MKKKQNVLKSSSKPQGRRSNKDTFVVSAKNIRVIRQIAEDAKLPVETVFDDLVEIGVKAVPEVYASLIQYRKSLSEIGEQNEPKPVASTTSARNKGPVVIQGVIHEPPVDGQEWIPATERENGTSELYSDAGERPGQLPESGEAARVLDEP